MVRRGSIFFVMMIMIVGLSLLTVALLTPQAKGRIPETGFADIEYMGDNDGLDPPPSHKADTDGYTSHSNIVITSNADFAAEASAEGWPGDGSALNPYIISGLEIDTTDICIYIRDTTVHFEIRNCFFSAPSGTGTAAVEFYSVTNGNIKDCISDASRGGPGFFLSQSSDNVFINNTVNGNSKGFELIQSSNGNTLIGNTVISSDRGFSVRDSNNCKLIGNTATDNSGSGFRLTECFNTTVANNTSTGNTLFGLVLRDSSHTILSNNTCTSNGYSGFAMSHSSNHNTVTENSAISNSANGFFIYGSSSYNTFTSNIIAFNSDEGIDLSSSASSNNTFFLNVFYDNGGVNARDDGANNTWDDGASSGNYWDDYGGDGSYVIPGGAGSQDRYPFEIMEPALDSPEDLSYKEGTTGHSITWSPVATFPLSYTVMKNDTMVDSGDWNGSEIVIEVDGLLPGLHKYTLVVEDRFGNTASDIVFVSVFADSEGGPILPGEMIAVGVGIGVAAAVILLSYVFYTKWR